MQFALFTTSISSMGVASSCWSVIFTGNVELSIIMNVINTVLACGESNLHTSINFIFVSQSFSIIKNTGTIPFWLFTLGKSIFDCECIGIPYDLIGEYMCFSFIPLFIGTLIQYFCPSSSEISKPILMGISFPFLIFIILVSVLRGLHIFSLTFSDAWKVNTKRYYVNFSFELVFMSM